MERTLLSFIWQHSRRDQIVLVLMTLILFPMLYLTLELPKRIINDAIGAPSDFVTLLGIDVAQTTLLIGLCFAFLGSVIVHGLLKMRVNTMKGVLAERLLRRFRFALIGRTLRFPRIYQQQTSEGELIAALTAEAEPLGGIMGDAIANPLLQAGQMLTILLFLFLQNIWFGLAAMAMIPLQAWLIPRLQKRINVLNRSRIRQVRTLAAEVGEITSGAATLRQHGGWTARLSGIAKRLGRLFDTRFDIYRKKFFMKFLNNLIGQITPFFFFLVGGLLVINGALTLGALVASLAAFKDLSSPWKELLTYYTDVQEVSQRYQMIIERFDPPDMLSNFLTETRDAPLADVTSASVALRGVVVQDDVGRPILNGADLEVAAGSWLCVVAPEEEERALLAQLLVRDVAPESGQVTLGDHDLAMIDQYAVSQLVGYAGANPYIFRGTVGDNVMMPLVAHTTGEQSPAEVIEAQRSGNVQLHSAAPAVSTDAIATARCHWQQLVTSIGAQKPLLMRALDQSLSGAHVAHLELQLTALRKPIHLRLTAAKLESGLQTFATNTYFDDFTLAENLLSGIKKKHDWIGAKTSQQLRRLLVDLGLIDIVIAQSLTLAQTLIEAFDADTAGTVLFRRLGIPSDMLPKLKKVIEKSAGTAPAVQRFRLPDELLLLSLQFNVPARVFDRAFSEPVKQAIVDARAKAAELAGPDLTVRYAPLDVNEWNDQLNVLENLIFGKLTPTSRQDLEQIREEVVQILIREIDDDVLFELIEKLPTGLRGANLSAQIAEHISLAQVVVKKPAVVVLDRAMASFPDPVRLASFALLREILPQATIVQLEPTLPESGLYDHQLELRQGRLVPVGMDTEEAPDSIETSDLNQKLAALRKAPLFRELSRAQLRLLAFSARWIDYAQGKIIFRKGDLPDGAYLIFSGTVELFDEDEAGTKTFSVTPPSGTLVGELGLIRNDPRRLTMQAQTDVTLLRIDAEDFLSILESDARTAFKLIQHLVSYIGAGK